MESVEKKSLNFIEQIIEKELSANPEKKIFTRFPPEPNGYLHIGHAKSICLNFGLANKYGGKCNLRFDDTNPAKEDTEYVNSIMDDIKWLGFEWNGEPRYASDYFEQLYSWGELLIKKNKAYVCDMSADEVAQSRGTPTVPGKESPYRNRSIEENLELFSKMKDGGFPDGTKTLRAKTDMSTPNMQMRDPVLYRILRSHHHRTGDKWCIYPMYDFAHGQSDFIEGITHSICTLEFEIHRPLYDWFLDQICEEDQIRPRQIEFARLNLTYTVMSKRILLDLVKSKTVSGWDDPRMPTICGIRRRGYTSEAVRTFAEKIGVSKTDSTVDFAFLEHCVREDLNKKAKRVMAVLNPLKLTIKNYPENQTEEIELINNPEDETAGKRKVPFSKTLYIEREDFAEVPPPKYHRLFPGNEVRLRGTYFVKCTDFIKDSSGNITEIICEYDPQTKTGYSPDGRKVKGTIHWVSADQALQIETRLYDKLFLKENPFDTEEGKDYKTNINPDSLKVIKAYIEPTVSGCASSESYQFERHGYFCVDYDSTPEKIVFNKTVSLKDSFNKINK
ncbi:MAG TPA: glutamine--tRNA ligase/YqeY domain fusion protein [Spirochaetota bacterium]|nr:glutamine--tRNA ligase/YqeY domain fusion protein [Spirochaetota bacterium]HQO22563.1 glutamine--tRNA ligase/YqeY domain fusion protein [Spirochaetota bacterium]HQQ23773.1 glutamine--tRNA ligase/YqeY domain fusion protein [Spirochaetota bacterium]